MLAGFYTSDDEIKLQMQLLDIDLDDKHILPVVMEVDDYENFVNTSSSILQKNSLFNFSIINIVNELLGEHRNGIIVHVSQQLFCIIVSFYDIRSEAQIQNSTNYILSTISSCLKKFLQISVSFSIGSMCNSYQDIAASYSYAVNNLKNKFYLGKSCIIRDDYKAAHEDLSGLSIETEKQIILNLKQGDSEALEESLKNLFVYIKDHSLTINSVKVIFHDLLNIIIKVCKANNIELIKLFPAGQTPQEKVSAMQTIEDFKDWIIPIFEKLMKLNLRKNPQYASPYVNRTISYINRHYFMDISLSDAANELNIGSTYLSKLFKDETGIGFSEYLSNLRIEKAKLLLLDEKCEIKDIPAKCGFNSYDYFFKAFKKITGITPKKFIENINKSPI